MLPWIGGYDAPFVRTYALAAYVDGAVLDTIPPAELHVVLFLYARLSDDVPGLVALVVEQLELVLGDVPHISKHMGKRTGLEIVAYRLGPPGHARKFVEALGYGSDGLIGDGTQYLYWLI